MLSILLWVVALYMALGTVLSIASVGKPREPLSGTVAAVAALISAGIITVLILAAGALS